MENKSIPLSNINNKLKEHEHDKSILGAANTHTNSHMKGPWNHIYTSNLSPASASYSSVDNGYTKLSGFSWPPRLYVCSFCKREFRSAQALGGHMNVHRRDRARLRLSPSPSPSSPPDQLVTANGPPMTPLADSMNLNLIPNPNPNLIYSSAWMIQKPNNKIANYITQSSSSTPSHRPSTPFVISSPSAAPVGGMTRWSVARPNPFTTSTSTNTPNLIDAHKKEHHSILGVNVNNPREKGELLRLGFGTGLLLRKEEVDLELRLGYSS